MPRLALLLALLVSTGATAGRRVVELEHWAHQAEFLSAEEHFVLLRTGYGGGKTHVLAQWAVMQTHQWPHVGHVLAAPTFRMARQDVVPAVIEFLDTIGVKYEYNKSNWHIRPEWCTAEQAGIWIPSCEDPHALKGPNRGSIGINEPGLISFESYQVLLSRARIPLIACDGCGRARQEPPRSVLKVRLPKVGSAYRAQSPCPSCACESVVVCPNLVRLAGTPEGFTWLYEEFVNRSNSRHKDRDWSQYRDIKASTSANLALPADYQSRLLENFDEKLAQEKVHGEFVNVTDGRIYYAFDREVHLTKTFYDPSLPLLWSFDFNISPYCTIIAQRHGDSLWVIDEIVAPDAGSTSEIVEEFHRRTVPLQVKGSQSARRSSTMNYGQHEAGITVFGDASGRHRDTRTLGQRSDYHIIEETASRLGLKGLDIDVARANPSIKDRHASVNARLRNAKDRRARVWFSDELCPRVVKDMEQQVYKAGSMIPCSGTGDDRGMMGHAGDALGYMTLKLWPLLGGGIKSIPTHA